MRHFSFMEKLLDGIEVEWKVLSEVGELVRGNGLPKTDFTESGVPAIHYGQIYTHYGLCTSSTISFVSEKTADKLKKVNKGDVIITNTSENLEDVGKSVVYLGNEQAVTGGHATIFKPSEIILGKYFAYYTQTNAFSSEKRKYAKGAKVIDVSASDMAKIQVPLPPIHIQVEVVRILDTFRDLTSALSSELAMRKKQYSYYRAKLLNFNDSEIEWKSLSEVSEYSKKRISFDLLDTENYVSVENLLQNCAGKAKANRVPTSGNLTQYNSCDILIGNIRPYLKKIWYADSLGGTNGDVLVISSTDARINNRYLYQLLADDGFFEYNMQHAKGAKMPRGNKAKIMDYRIPVPSVEEQKRIVSILDKFNTLIHSTSEGLPKEIELRQKQYEYYRDLLLSFPKPREAEV
ncbi:type I restriction-modification system specificity determinant [Vibrio splendidus 12B01]|nr:type I restriction-modification system specificity determinant [Vibrio splendidus 12B01]OCH63269.1 restriction endonuclease [Vibrio splendidus]